MLTSSLMGSAAYREAEAQSLANKIISIANRVRMHLRLSPIPRFTDHRLSCTAHKSQSTPRRSQKHYQLLLDRCFSATLVFDSGYKYMYDRFADKFRYVPLNGDVAGCCCSYRPGCIPLVLPSRNNPWCYSKRRTFSIQPNTDPERPSLLRYVLTPVMFSNDAGGIVLYGDKTAIASASSFDRINVRRLFIYIEGAIEAAAQDQLFEFNDEVTRTNFVNIVEPFLRDVSV